MAILGRKTILSKLTEDINEFKGKIEKDEMVDKILISPFIKDSLNAGTYDLHAGEEYEKLLSGEKGEISEEKPLIIKPSEVVNILTYEYLGLPQSVSAIITSKLSLSMLGSSQLSTHIDPGFYGKLIETIANLSNREIIIKYKDPICSVLFLNIDDFDATQRYRGRYKGKEKIWDSELEKGKVSKLVPYSFLPIYTVGVLTGVAFLLVGLLIDLWAFIIGGLGLLFLSFLMVWRISHGK